MAAPSTPAQGSRALVEAKVSKGRARILVREIRGRVRRPGGSWVEVRFWTSLLDWREYPARELLALYARRWEPFDPFGCAQGTRKLRAEWQELMYKELKVDLRQADLLRSHTVETAAQEVAHSARSARSARSAALRAPAALRVPAALVIAHAMLAEQRLGAARFVEEDVLRISPSAGSGP